MKNLFLLVLHKFFPSLGTTASFNEEIIIRRPDIDLSKSTINQKEWEQKIDKAAAGKFPYLQLTLLHCQILDLNKFADSRNLSIDVRDTNAKVIGILIIKLHETAKPYREPAIIKQQIILN